jgi:adenylate cyclase
MLGSLRMTAGMAADETELISERVHVLAEQVGSQHDRFRAFSNLRNLHTMRGDARAAALYGERMFAIAEQERDDVFMLYAHAEGYVVKFYDGASIAIRPHIRAVREIYNAERHRPALLEYGFDALAVTLGHEALLEWATGAVDRALVVVDEAIQVAEVQRHAFMIGFAVLWRALLHVLRGEHQKCLDLLVPMEESWDERGYADWLAIARIARAWARAPGRETAAVSEISAAIEAYCARRSQLLLTLFQGLLADVALAADDLGTARATVEEGLDTVERNGERAFESELHRLLGAVTEREATDDAGLARAEAHYQQAIAIARTQEARSWELRATMSLARLWMRSRRNDDALQILSGVFQTFTEGWETADLREAQGLLDVLRAASNPSIGVMR